MKYTMKTMNSTTKEVCIRKFGLSPPKDWSDDCDAELSLMIELWNNLVNIEYENRSAIKDLIYRNEDLKEINCKIDTYHARLSDEHIPDTVTAHKYIIELQRKRTILIKQATKEYAAEVRQIEYDRTPRRTTSLRGLTTAATLVGSVWGSGSLAVVVKGSGAHPEVASGRHRPGLDPEEAFKVVGEVGEPDLGPGSG